MLILENTFQTRMSVSISVSVSLRWSVFRPHSTATLQPRDVNMLWASVSVSVSNFGSKEGGTLNLLLTLFRRKGLDCRSLWAFDKLQLMSSWMSFSDFDCADYNFVMEGEGEDSLASKRRVEANSGFRWFSSFSNKYKTAMVSFWLPPPLPPKSSLKSW